jgi:predicted amidohydrolase
VRVALIQFDIAWEDVAENHRRVHKALAQAAAAGARVAVLPEMFPTGFSMDANRLAQPPGGASETFLKKEAGALGIWLIGSLPEAGSPAPRNTALIVSPKGDVIRYAKIHPFTFAKEDRHYAAGDRVITANIRKTRFTPFICYDLRFPEPFRVAAPETDVFVVLANWPEARRDHWRTLLRARAIENQAYVLGVNRIGEGGGLAYAGDSAAISPLGEALVEASRQEAVLVCDVEPAEVARVRAAFPALHDRRPEAYRR